MVVVALAAVKAVAALVVAVVAMYMGVVVVSCDNGNDGVKQSMFLFSGKKR